MVIIINPSKTHDDDDNNNDDDDWVQNIYWFLFIIWSTEWSQTFKLN